MSPSFFERCEREYPNAIGFVRRYIPLGWPKPVEEKPEEPFSVSMSSKELEEEVTRILQQVDPVAMEEEEEVAHAIAPEEVNPLEIEHIMSVLAAARLMMEKEVELREKEVECEKKEKEVVESVKKEVVESVEKEVVESVEKEVVESVKKEVVESVKKEVVESVEEVAEAVKAKEEESEVKPVEETPVKETPIEETPVKQKQQEEKPAESQPSQPQPTPTEAKRPQPTEMKQPSPSEAMITQLTEKIVTLESSLRQHSLEENDRVKAILKKQGDMLEDDVRSVIGLSSRSRNASPSCRSASSPNSKRKSAPQFWKKPIASWSGTGTAWRASASCTPPRSPSTMPRRSRTKRTS